MRSEFPKEKKRYEFERKTYPVKFKHNVEGKKSKNLAEAIKMLHNKQDSIANAFALDLSRDPEVELDYHGDTSGGFSSISAQVKDGKVNLYPPFFQNRSNEDRATTLAHELLHVMGHPEHIEGHESGWALNPGVASRNNTREINRILWDE